MGFFVMFLISMAFMVAGELLRPKQKFDDAKPSALGDFQFPTADASRVIPVFWGTCKLQGPNCTYFGDLSVTPINKKVKTGWFSSDIVTQGHHYNIGVQLVWAWGEIDEFIQLLGEDRPIALSGMVETADYYQFWMNAPTHMSADEPTNGLTGAVKLYKGTTTQPVNEYLQSVWGEVESSPFRRVCYAAFEHCYFGNSDTPPAIGLIARRTPNQLGLTGGKHNVNGDANIACACYEVMTDRIWGLKMLPSKIDIASFIACGNTMFDEGLGISMLVDNPLVGKDLLSDMLRHGDAVIYPDPMTGLYTMKLARKDYVVEDLPVFDDTNVDNKGFEFSRTSWEETKNTTIVNYTDRSENFAVRPAQYQDLANIDVRRGVIDAETIDFLGLSNATNGKKAAERANKTRSSPLVRAQFTTNREGYDLRPGSVFLLDKPSFNLLNLIMRVIEISYGTLDDPAIRVTCTEDIFAANGDAYLEPGPGGWVPPDQTPQPLFAQRLEEAPHFGAPNDQPYVITLATRGGPFDLRYEIWSDPTGGTDYTLTGTCHSFTPSALLVGALPASGPEIDETGFTVSTGIDLASVIPGASSERENGSNLVLINDEILAWRNRIDNGDGTMTFQGIYRAALDTLPGSHVPGDRVWFFSEGGGLVDPNGYSADLTVRAKLLPSSARGTLPIASAVAMTKTTVSRSLRPIVPGKIRVNATRPADLVGTVSGSFSLTWAHRNRNDTLVRSQSDNSVTPETGQAYNIRMRNATTNALLVEKTGVVAAAAAVELAYTGNVKMQIESVRDGLTSRAVQEHVFAYDGTGVSTSKITAQGDTYVLDGGGA